MRAKLINEIKQNNTNALSSIGIGRTALAKEYDYMERYMPTLIGNTEKLSDMDIPNEVKNKVAEFLDTSVENIVGISYRFLSNKHSQGIYQDFKKYCNTIWANFRLFYEFPLESENENYYLRLHEKLNIVRLSCLISLDPESNSTSSITNNLDKSYYCFRKY